MATPAMKKADDSSKAVKEFKDKMTEAKTALHNLMCKDGLASVFEADEIISDLNTTFQDEIKTLAKAKTGVTIPADATVGVRKKELRPGQIYGQLRWWNKTAKKDDSIPLAFDR